MENREGHAHGTGELGDDSWIAGEVAGCEFTDARLGKRLGSLLHQISGSIGGTVPLACQDWANTKAAYRFFSNERVDEGAILAGHFQVRISAIVDACFRRIVDGETAPSVTRWGSAQVLV